MVNPTQTEQLLALNSILQRGLTSAANEVAVTASVIIERATFELETVARAMVLEGTAIAGDLDQVLMRTAQGDILLRGEQIKQQNILNMLPGRVSLQLRPGPNGLEAVLVVGNKPLNKTQESLSAGGSQSSTMRQTLSTEIPKIGQVHEVLVLPNTLFSANADGGRQGNRGGVPGQVHSTAELGGAIGAAMGMAEESKGIKAGTPQAQAQNLAQALARTLQQGTEPDASPQPQYHPAPDGQEEAAQQHAQQQGGQRPSQQQLARQQTPQFQPEMSAPGRSTATSSLPNPQSTNMKIMGVAMPGQPTPMPVADTGPEGPYLTATVRELMPSGQPVLEVDDQIIAVKTGRNWPVGTQLLVLMGKNAAVPTVRELAGQETRHYEGLREALELLAQSQPSLHRDVISSRLPGAGNAQQTASAILFFFAALQKGNLEQWLGSEAKESLSTLGRAELVKKIQDEWQKAHIEGFDPANGEWRGFTLPFTEHDKLQQFYFFIHGQQGRKQENKEKDGAWARRFMIEISLSRLGPIQMEGLVRQRHLDLMVRTDAPLDPSLQKDLTQRFAAAMEEVRFTGNLQFRANKIGWVDIKKRQAPHVVRQI